MGSENLMLPRSSVRVCYKAYHNTYKGIEIGPNDLSLEDAVNQELTPGKIEKENFFTVLKSVLSTLTVVRMRLFSTRSKK